MTTSWAGAWYTRAADATLQEVAAACSKALASPTRMRCLNPDCRRKIDRPAAGRLPLFCGRSCREAFDYERAEGSLPISRS